MLLINHVFLALTCCPKAGPEELRLFHQRLRKVRWSAAEASSAYQTCFTSGALLKVVDEGGGSKDI